MTDTTITQGFIEMVKAYEAKPGLEETIADLRQDVEFFERNLRIEEDTSRALREANANLMAQLEGVKKERDDAMFRSLELEEKFSGIEKLLGVAERLEQARKAGIDQAVQAMNEHDATVDTMTPKPLVEAAVVTEQGSTIVEPSYPGPIDPVVVSPQGQSENRPTVTDSAEVLIEQPTTTSKDGPETQTPSDWDRNDTKQYLNKPWSEKPWWVTPGEWYDAGGCMA